MRSFTKEWLKASNDDLLIISDIIHRENLTHMVAFHYGKPSSEDAKEFYDFALEIFNKVCGILDIKKELK